ncbi:MAG: YcaO-like family protein [Bacteriovorax sp.]|nr:YcaO-like family protein [Bacteriovorax sp.]
MIGIKEILQATFASRDFSQFFDGVEFYVPNSTTPVIIKISSCQRSHRTPGWRIVKHSIETKIEASNGVFAYGFGEHDFELLAVQKSIAEGVERCVFKILKETRPEFKNSNGWAAHLTKSKAQASARSELLERDAALLHWLSQTQMDQIDPASLPSIIQNWINRELDLAPRFNRIKILVTKLGIAPVVATFIHDQDEFGFISQATASCLQAAIEKALTETCRIADFYEKGISVTTSIDYPTTPEEHANYYALVEKLPSWLFGNIIDWKLSKKEWANKHKMISDQNLTMVYEDYQCGPLHISYCQSSQVQNLFFGPTESALTEGLINKERIKNICGVGQLCFLPHFIP